MRRRPAALAAAVVVVAALAIGLLQAGGPPAAPDRDAAPSLAEARRAVAGAPPPLARLYARGTGSTILDLDRAGVRRLLRSLRGRPVVVNVWGSWCGPCRDEFPLMRRAAARYGDRVAFLGVDLKDRPGAARAFLRGEPTVYPHVTDRDGTLTRETFFADPDFPPSTTFLDPDGGYRAYHRGAYASYADLERDIRRYTGATPTSGGSASGGSTDGRRSDASAPGGEGAPDASATSRGSG